jgi:membrane protein DedA with SNARE-associated domain
VDPNTFNSILALISKYGYFVILLIMIAEGPIITTAAAFAAGAGIFNIYAIIFLSILGDTIADVLYFGIGFWGRTALIEKYGQRFGLTSTKLERIQHLLHKNALKTIVAIKLAPGLAPPGLAVVGASKMPIKKYAAMVSLVTLPKCLFFAALGFYAERVHVTVINYFRLGVYGFPIAFIFILFGIYIFRKVAKKIVERIEKY